MTEGRAAPHCEWSSAPVAAGAQRCPECGAALILSAAIADLPIPGVTTVDPALAAYQAQPLHIPNASPTQGAASGAIMAAAIGGPIGIAAAGGLAALAAAEFMGARRGDRRAADPDSVGRLSGYVQRALDSTGSEVSAPDESPPGHRADDFQPGPPDGAR